MSIFSEKKDNFFLRVQQIFSTPDLKSPIKSNSIKWGQIPKNVKLSPSHSPIKTEETIFEVTFRATVTGLNYK